MKKWDCKTCQWNSYCYSDPAIWEFKSVQEHNQYQDDFAKCLVETGGDAGSRLVEGWKDNENHSEKS